MRDSTEGDRKDSSTILETGPQRVPEWNYARAPNWASRILQSRGRDTLSIACRKRREHCWKLHAKHSATGLRVVTKDLSSVFLNDAKADAESKPGTFADRFGVIERIENAVRLFDSRSGIGKQNRPACGVAHGLDRQRAPAVVRLHGV